MRQILQSKYYQTALYETLHILIKFDKETDFFEKNPQRKQLDVGGRYNPKFSAILSARINKYATIDIKPKIFRDIGVAIKRHRTAYPEQSLKEAIYHMHDMIDPKLFR